MPDIFDFDKANLKRFEKFLKHSPREAQKATAGVLNSLAFQARKDMIESIGDTMTVRSPSFVKGSFRVDKTRAGKIETQEAEAGSINRKGFKGWEEKQFGKAPGRTTVPLLGARVGNSWKKRQRKKSIVGGGNRFKRRTDFRKRGARSIGQSFYSMLEAARNREFTEPFIVGTRESGKLRGKFSAFKPGVYQKLESQIYRIHDFDDYDPRKINWMGFAIKKLDNSINLDRIWRKQLELVLNFRDR